MHRRALTGLALAVLLLAGACAPTPPQGAGEALGGTSWRLARFEGGDGVVVTPDDRSKYTVAFGADGSVNVRVDCNRGRGKWISPGPGQLELGPMALTRAACPPGSLHDLVVKQWGYIRTYLLRGDRLYLSLMADGGTFEFERHAQ